MRYIIVGAGNESFVNCFKAQKDDFYIAVDGGIKSLEKRNIMPDIFVGDNDSAHKSNIQVKVKKIILNPIKDKSDLEYVLKMVFQNYNSEEILIYNATGKRADHSLANIRLLLIYNNLNITIIDEYNRIYLIKDTKEITKSSYKYISFFNVYDNTEITLKGFKYELDKHILSRFDNLCLSNEIIDKGIIKVNKKVICIESFDSI